MKIAIDFILLQLQTYLWNNAKPDVEIVVEEVLGKNSVEVWNKFKVDNEILLIHTSMLGFLGTSIEEIEVIAIYGDKMDYHEWLTNK